MIKRTLFVLLLAGLMFAPAELFAQKAYKANIGGYDRIILDMSETGVGIGMPADAITNIPKVGATLVTAEANNQMYEKLEIAPRNMGGTNASPQLVATPPGAKLNWEDGDARCRGLNYNGVGGWRLPTHREMTMIWIFRNALIDLGSTPFTPDIYWTATESIVTLPPHLPPEDFSFSFNFGGSGGGGGANNRSTYYIRCVRETL